MEWVSGITITPSSLVAGEAELPLHDIAQARPTGVYYLVTDGAGREIHASNEELNDMHGRLLFERR